MLRLVRYALLVLSSTLYPCLVLSSPVAAADDYTIKLGGRLQLDYAWFNSDKTELDDGGEVRRARLYISGDIKEDWDYKIQLDFAGGEAELKDGYVRYEGLGPGRLWIGNFKQPAGLELLTSSKHTTFMERGLVTDVNEGRRMGVAYQYVGGQYTLMGSVFGDEANGVQKGSGAIGRVTWAPIKGDDEVLHLGLSSGIGRPEGGLLRIRVRPEAHATDDRILDTGPITDVEDVLRTGLEAAWVMKRFSVQGEYLAADITRTELPDLSFDGWYVYASFFLTPDTRPYDFKDGIFKGVKPVRGGGAWEVAVRYSTLNLTDQDIRGGEGEVISLGVNWYANKYLRFSANYFVANTDVVAGDDDPSGLQVRMQIAF